MQRVSLAAFVDAHHGGCGVALRTLHPVEMDVAVGAIFCVNIDRHGFADSEYQEGSTVHRLILRADRKLGCARATGSKERQAWEKEAESPKCDRASQPRRRASP
ncbi:hypothetical protein predicted by Glimmer/Critica [Sorangium cellulosum So ce56]|uniref:Uncharacterized protein n=1 Tax=Sorangium cellulosum (strain So ce56) TaxID=448385 RepID=A9ENG2_SORC5|nr:hypothetical protein predicted by Glimmer/Critica [Sorangium cellulosum So ce56]